MTERDKKTVKIMNCIIYILLIVWICLLVVLIAIYSMRLQGYESFEEWKNRKEQQKITEVPGITPMENPALTGSPEPTEGIVPTKSPEPSEGIVLTGSPEPSEGIVPTGSLAPTGSPAPTEALHPTITPVQPPTIEPTEAPGVTVTPTPTEVPIVTLIPGEPQSVSMAELSYLQISGFEKIDKQIREQLVSFAGEEDTLLCEEYFVGNYFSVVFRKEIFWEGEKAEYLLPLVYDITTGEQVTGSDLIKETYFAVIKERLQTVVAELFPGEAASSFVSYAQPYKTVDYEQFYLTEDYLVFYFDETTLVEGGHRPFTYAADLDEAEAFFYYNLDGSQSGHAIRELDPDAKMIALTYDDGPAFGTIYDLLLRDLFEEYDAKATFFFVGNRLLPSYQYVAEELYNAGHEIASHSYSHTDMNAASPEVVWQEVNQTNLVIAQATGHAPDYIRLPGGTNGEYLKNLPMPIIKWNLDTIDWRDRDAELLFERMKEKAKDGSIVLLHSIRGTTYEATKLFLPWLKEQGYEIVTLSELFYYKGVTPENGVEYTGFSE